MQFIEVAVKSAHGPLNKPKKIFFGTELQDLNRNMTTNLWILLPAFQYMPEIIKSKLTKLL